MDEDEHCVTNACTFFLIEASNVVIKHT